MMDRRHADPEQWTEDRDHARARDDETDRRGTRSERALEDLVYGDSYQDWHGQLTEQSVAGQRLMQQTLANARSLGQVRA